MKCSFCLDHSAFVQHASEDERSVKHLSAVRSNLLCVCERLARTLKVDFTHFDHNANFSAVLFKHEHE